MDCENKIISLQRIWQEYRKRITQQILKTQIDTTKNGRYRYHLLDEHTMRDYTPEH